MQKILRKRLLRDLKANAFRYLALALLIILSMYLIVSLVSAAETVIGRVEELAESHHLEDGEFTVFVPLTKEQEKDLEDKGAVLESMFYLDFSTDKEETLRLFKTREELNLLSLETGRAAKAKGEAVLEKRYCQEQQISVGDTVKIGKQKLKVVGIGSVPDYDAPLKELSDSSVDSRHFGLAFVDDAQYESLKAEKSSIRTESFTYAYSLSGELTDEMIKEMLQDFAFSSEQVDDPWFQEYWDRTGGKKEEIQDGVQKLGEGAEELRDGLDKLDDNKELLTEGAQSVFDSYLKEASEGFSDYGLSENLTKDNYEALLQEMEDKADSALVRLRISLVRSQLKELEQYADGTAAYTEGVSDAAKGAGELADGTKKLEEHTDQLLEQYFDTDLSNLTQFLPVEDNPRVKASSEDQIVNKVAGLIAGVIVLILFSYVISVFVIHNIEEESSIIGALYALGVKKKELILHYLALPVLVAAVSGAIGTCIGFSRWGLNIQIQECYDYFSVPVLDSVYSPYLLVYGICLPPVLAALINFLIMNRKLGSPALSLMRREQKGSRIRNLHLGDMGFISRFRIRQMLRELRSAGTVLFGMFISLLILMLGVNCYVMCRHISSQNREDTKFEYMYTYKYPDEQVPKGGTEGYAVTLQKENLGYHMDVTLLGIEIGNPYFQAQVRSGENKIVLSSAAAQKFGWSKGSQIVLTDKENDRDYAFTVEDIVQYSAALFVFMDIDSMRTLLGQNEDYFNVVFSHEELDIPSGQLYAVTSREDIVKSADVFIDMMMPLIGMMTGVSVLVFGMVMYLMMKVMIDRSAFGISLIKVFGYRTKEIQKLYLNGNFYMIAAGAALCLPLAKKTMDVMYPAMVANVACAMDLSFSWQMYLGIYGGIILLYFIIRQLLVGRLKKMMPAEVLKNRE